MNLKFVSSIGSYTVMNPRSIYLVTIPLVLSAFTHLWNPLGFPSFWYVEEIYLQRAMYVLHGLGNVDPLTTYGHPYDHPYFGQLLLAGFFKIINYPDLLNPSASMPSLDTSSNSNGDFLYSINVLHLIPRLLIGSLAVLDTFLIYKIAEHSYHNKTVAFMASIIFAVIPATWLMRKILLENLLLPFLLSSILFAVHYRKSSRSKTHPNKASVNQSILVVISGIFMAIAIFIKIPALTMIPLVCFLLFNRADKNLIHIVLWLIPVILIPIIWPFNAILDGELDLWLRDLLWQTQRQGDSLLSSLTTIFEIDPVLIVVGIAGLVYAEMKRDYMILLWAVPFLIFLFLMGFVSFFYLIPLIPLFCIAGARLIEDLVSRINNKRNRRIMTATIILSIVIFGIISSTLLITTNVNSSYLEVYAFVAQHIVQGSQKAIHENKQVNEKNGARPSGYNDGIITLIGNVWTRGYYWIPKYVFDTDVDIILLPSSVSSPPAIHTEKILLKLDNHVLRSQHNNEKDSEHLKWLNRHNSTTKKIAEFTEKSPIFKDYNSYPYSGSMNHNRGIAATEFRAN